jgi:Ca-activated chloride channel homolog
VCGTGNTGSKYTLKPERSFSMKNFVLLLVLLLSISLYGQHAAGIIEGKVTDLQTGEPLIGANVFLDSTRLGTSTDVKGFYRILNVPAGSYSITAKYIGYKSLSRNNIKVTGGKTVVVDFPLTAEAYSVSEILIVSERPQVKGSRTNSVAYYVDQTGMSPFEGSPDFNTEEYGIILENDFFSALDKPLSTFSVDVDAASYSNCRRFITDNQLPPAGAVRIEEFINYFDYDYPAPKDDKPFSVTLEYSDCPWNNKAKLLHIGLKGKEIARNETKANNLVFLIDVSGSMKSPDKLPLVQRAFNMLVDQLESKDRIAIVVYAGAAGVVLPSVTAGQKDIIKNAINSLHAGGSTAGGEGLRLAYKIAEENFIKDGNNRIILATDGDFNIGISSTSELVDFIEKKRDKGIFFTALGFGMGNYKDERLQQLADKGNGTHGYIDNIMEAKKIFVNELTATLYTIAKDVKIQVEFNPAKVESYRLVGYENRLLNDKDFKDDKKDAGEIGSGHTVTVLYEIIPVKDDSPGTEPAALKYQVKNIRPEAYSGNELLSLKIRYKKPDEERSIEYETVLRDTPVKISKASDNFIFSAAVAEFAMLLKDSKYKGSASFAIILEKGKKSLGKDEFGYRQEFISIVEKAKLLSENPLIGAE